MDFPNLKATAEIANLIANGLSETSSYYFHLQTVAKWLSCNGEAAGVGPTAVVASAAAVYLYHELRASVRLGAGGRVAVLEKLLLSTMVLGALALMVHVWVCATRFFLYYLDTLVRESPCILLELTTAGLLGARSEAMLGPLTKFVRDQQHQIHITVCWFLALCYADYVRKHYCETFNFPYLEQWQTRLQQRTSRTVRSTAEHVGSFVTCVQQRLQALAGQPCDGQAIRDVLALGVRYATQAQFRPSELSQMIAEQDLDIEFLDVL